MEFIREELLELSVSVIADLGTTPCFFTRAANMSHWPPSEIGLCNNQATVRSSTGWSAVSIMASNK